MINTKDIADYYNQTLNHYQLHWKLDLSKALHYGLWYDQTQNLPEALENTNKKIAQVAGIKEHYNILDAGCGIGGTAIYLASIHKCNVHGITLSQKQLNKGQKHVEKNELEHKIKLSLMNYEETQFENNSFDLVYGIESICHSVNKEKFIKEALRILKPEGKLIVIDFFQSKPNMSKKEQHIMNEWLKRWAVDRLSSVEEFVLNARNQGLQVIEKEDLTKNVALSSKKLYHASLLGSVPSFLYSIYNRDVSRYAKSHYKSGIYQYKALKMNLWNYAILAFQKPSES